MDELSLVTFTRAAAQKAKTLAEAEQGSGLLLRVLVKGGGCSGLEYAFQFEEAPQADDLCVHTEGVTLLVDPTSLQYLEGAQIDYMESLKGSHFVIRNPVAKSTCGCGASLAHRAYGASKI